MRYAELEELLKQAMGLDAKSIGSLAVQRAVQVRMRACAIRELSAYCAHVRTSPVEIQALIEAVAVPETWFFRDGKAFTALSHFVTEEWLPEHPEGTLRLLSLPCSSGEEPYSMAMALLDAGVPAGRFHIDAYDISERVLVDARRAHYGKNSFRGADLTFRDRYFDPAPHGYCLHRLVCEQVRFHQGNLLDPSIPVRASLYDFIFCRNLLIYFDRDTQDQAVRTLRGVLAERGVLFVAPSETGLLFKHDFASTKIPLAFAFRAESRPAAAGVQASPTRSPIGARFVTSGVAPTSVSTQAASCRPPIAHADSSAERGIDAASRLADLGELEEAAKCCEAHVLRCGPSADAYYLMGMIRAAAGVLSEADQSYRKALYLDPNHAEALLNLALLLEEQGARAEAKVLRARHSRLGKPLAQTHER
jgi:chemotaxis protein methyltransferase WspC